MDSLTAAVGEYIGVDDPTDVDLPELARRLQQSKALAARLKDLTDALELEIAARVEQDITVVPGVGIVRRGYTRRSQWRDSDSASILREDIGHAVTTTVARDNATGEIDPFKRNVARATVDAMYEILPAFYSIKAGAKKYGLRIGEYRTYSDVAVVNVDPVEEL